MSALTKLMAAYWRHGAFGQLGWWCFGGLLMWLGPAYWLWFTGALLALCAAITVVAWWRIRIVEKELKFMNSVLEKLR